MIIDEQPAKVFVEKNKNLRLLDEEFANEDYAICIDKSNTELKEKIDEIIKKFDMDSFKHQRIDTLSTGQYQRTSISRCVVHDPKYYILDEPTSGLDVISSKVIIDFVKEAKANKKTILYSTHYMEEAENICDKIVMVNKGKVIIIGTPEEIRNKTKTYRKMEWSISYNYARRKYDCTI